MSKPMTVDSSSNTHSVRPKVVFVGSFLKRAEDGTVGGQMQACRTLVDSVFSESIDWLLIDTTQRSLPLPTLLIRVSDACRRLLTLVGKVLARPDCLLLFSSYDPPSFLEKGTMCLLGRCLGL